MIEIHETAHCRRKRHVNLIVLIADIQTLAALGQHTDNDKRHTIYEQALPQRRRSAKKIISYRVSQDGNPGDRPLLRRIEQFACGRRPVFNDEIIWLASYDRSVLGQVARLVPKTLAD